MTKLKWRLSKLPTPEEVRELVKDQILTKEEAREILFNPENEVDKEALEAEIKFLRNLVEKLSNGRSQIVETIRYIDKPYANHVWFKQYDYFCGGAGSINNALANNVATSNSLLAVNDDTINIAWDQNGNTSFSDIKTF